MAPVERRRRKRPHNFPSDFTLVTTDVSRDVSARRARPVIITVDSARRGSRTRREYEIFPGGRRMHVKMNGTLTARHSRYGSQWRSSGADKRRRPATFVDSSSRDVNAIGMRSGAGRTGKNRTRFTATSSATRSRALSPRRTLKFSQLTRLAGNAPPATSARYSVAGAPDARDGAVARALEIHSVAANVEREAVRAILLVVFARGTSASFGNDRLFRGERAKRDRTTGINEACITRKLGMMDICRLDPCN